MQLSSIPIQTLQLGNFSLFVFVGWNFGLDTTQSFLPTEIVQIFTIIIYT